MKKQSKKAVIGILILLAVLVYPKISAFSADLVKTIQITYRDIKIYVDGELIMPKDAEGKIVEPFIYDGTTYLPARAISEALGKTVEWDGKTNSVYIGEPVSDVITEVTVSTAEELVSALGSNKRILLEEGVYNLSSVRPSVINNSSIYIDDVYDGCEFRLDGVHNLTIQGSGAAPSEIIIEPRYAFVLNFQNSSNINIINIKAGHTEDGYCMGGVFSFVNSSGIFIDKTLMYGCGTYGLSLNKVMNMKVTDSSIYGCTYGIMTVLESKDILFKRCSFMDNTGFEMVSVMQTSDFMIDSCEFLRNKGLYSDPMFSIGQSVNVEVKNSKFTDNQMEKLVDPADMKFDASNTFEDNTF